MFARILSMAFVCQLSCVCQAQLPSPNFSSVNYIGRYLGFGYSDGYHACKEEQCNSPAQRKPWESVSSFYGSPSLPPSNRFVGKQVGIGSTLYPQGYQFEQSDAPAQSSMPMMYPASNNFNTNLAPPQVQPNLQSPLQGVPPAPKQSPSSPSDRGTLESVPAAPRQFNPSANDRGPGDLPSPMPRSEPKSPEAQFRRVPQGSYSLIQPTGVRAR